MLEKPGIYKLTNINNNKCYIGSTTNLKKRRYQHFACFKRKNGNSAIKAAVAKYGKESFKFEVLEYFIIANKKILEEREQYYMDLIKPEYNIRRYASSNLGIKFSDSHIQMLKTMNIGRVRASEELDKLRKAVEVFNKKGDKIGEFNSLKEAGEALNLYPSNISKVCSGKYKTTGKLIFKYKC